jgi:hypothetical protein
MPTKPTTKRGDYTTNFRCTPELVRKLRRLSAVRTVRTGERWTQSRVVLQLVLDALELEEAELRSTVEREAKAS